MGNRIEALPYDDGIDLERILHPVFKNYVPRLMVNDYLLIKIWERLGEATDAINRVADEISELKQEA